MAKENKQFYWSAFTNVLGQVLFFQTIFLHLFLYYLAVFKGYTFLFYYLIPLQIYQVFFVKRNKYYIKQLFKNIFIRIVLLSHSEYSICLMIIKLFRNHLQKKLSHQQIKTQFKYFQLAFHPHGAYSYGLIYNMNTKDTPFENLVGLGSRFAMYSPFGGMLLQFLGFTGSDPANMKRLLSRGQNIGLYPGGYEENIKSTISTNKENRCYINKRKGFIKYSLRYGYTIHPVFTFGENQIFNFVDKALNFRLWLNKFKMPGCIPYTKYLFIPNSYARVITVIGKPLILPQIENPSQEDIDKYHQFYIEELKSLYEKYRYQYANGQELKLY